MGLAFAVLLAIALIALPNVIFNLIVGLLIGAMLTFLKAQTSRVASALIGFAVGLCIVVLLNLFAWQVTKPTYPDWPTWANPEVFPRSDFMSWIHQTISMPWYLSLIGIPTIDIIASTWMGWKLSEARML